MEKRSYPGMQLLLLMLSFLPFSLLAQNGPRHIPGDLIVQFAPGLSAMDWIMNWPSQAPRLVVDEQLSRPLNIWLLRFDAERHDERRLLSLVRASDGVRLAQFNHRVSMRETIPNDSFFDDQWQYINSGQSGGTPGADLDMDLAWDITTGGLTLTGDTIVVAVLDDGIDLDHPDLQQNRWYNHAEIPNNGLDDDDNGYVDDYRGWNIINNNDNIGGGGHGTPVAGIVGADGNNGMGVAGVNWHVKIMVVKNNFNTNEAKVLAAYSYPLEQRMRYNASGGVEGAFVVATNASWGVDGGQPDDSPIWCAFYDELGQHGILNCGATANNNTDVDEEGDLPTACPSEFLLSVTNVDHNDAKVTQAGYGLTTIDLGAFGEDTYTLANGDNYGGFGGTSGATPHVTGAIALLYSAGCPTLAALTEADPAAAALLVRDAILNGVEANASLEGLTVTGGRLNVYKSLNQLLDQCEGCIPPTSTRVTDVMAQQVVLRWNTNDSLQSVDLQWRPLGSDSWNTINNLSSPHTLFGLQACRTYEYQLIGNCSGESTAITAIRTFDTEGCCVAPDDLSVAVSPAGSALLTWSPIFAASAYDYRFRPAGSSAWTEATTVSAATNLTELAPCTQYEFELRTDCDTAMTAYNAVLNFQTLGCGPCLDEEYCEPTVFLNDAEYIAEVHIPGVLQNTTVAEENGYGDYGSLTPFPTVEQGATYPLFLTPAYVDDVYDEVFRIWIDFDQNGSFTSSESVYTSAQTNTMVEGAFTIPPDAPLGLTRMRVVMQFLSATSPCPFQGLNYGEAEDYCLEILPTSNCSAPASFSMLAVDTASAVISWQPVGPAVDYLVEIRRDGSSDWASVPATDTMALFSDLDACTAYEVRVRSSCFLDESTAFGFYQFTTECMTSVQDQPAESEPAWRIAPNPFGNELNLHWAGRHAGVQFISIFDALGRLVYQTSWRPSPEARLAIPAGNWPSGLFYIFALDENGNQSSQKVIKIPE